MPVPVAAVVSFLIGIFAAISAAAAPPILSKSFVDDKREITFKYPDQFQVARYKGQEQKSMPAGWRQVVLLVETKQLKGALINAIPEGEIPGIDLIETSGVGAQVQLGAIQQGSGAEYKKTFGSTTAYKLPGAFGPFGDQSFVYVVPIARDRVLMIIAHKYYFNDPSHSDRNPVNTKYDEVIDASWDPRPRTALRVFLWAAAWAAVTAAVADGDPLVGVPLVYSMDAP